MNPIIYALIAFPILFGLERSIHYYLVTMTYLILRRRKPALYLYAVILYPGVFLHEVSHWVMSNLLLVPTKSFSVWPRLDGDTLVMGEVQSATRSRTGWRVGPVRWSLIGGAPLLFGIGAILLIGFVVFDIEQVQATITTERNFAVIWDTILETPYWWVWLYLLFAISNSMMPSEPDRRAWPTLFVIVAVIVVILYGIGALEQVWIGMAPMVMLISAYLGVAFSITIVVNLLFLAVIFTFVRFLRLWIIS